jgi:hypothetical protein
MEPEPPPRPGSGWLDPAPLAQHAICESFAEQDWLGKIAELSRTVASLQADQVAWLQAEVAPAPVRTREGRRSDSGYASIQTEMMGFIFRSHLHDHRLDQRNSGSADDASGRLTRWSARFQMRWFG